ncbi:hypothetical protein SBF1_750011 [Candidatus Desulfosporosinus infrequens]|uniref:Uncharacterized protein n=1 Tax=Candidatus Desulfosporosinus infrequens TaxID=2043169 RepID=A0A2U3LR47_9FIRM|nr:hypothetical protein SBF1_750011 [Candidatus Desulfosporosinus infrequens]
MKLDAQLLSRSIQANLPPRGTSIKSEFRISIQNGELKSFVVESFLDIVGDHDVLKNTGEQGELADLMLKALYHAGFFGKINVQSIGRDIISVRASSIMGIERMYCSLCTNAQNDCTECNPALDASWRF